MISEFVSFQERLRSEFGSHKSIEERLQREKEEMEERFKDAKAKLLLTMEEEKVKAVEQERLKFVDRKNTQESARSVYLMVVY